MEVLFKQLTYTECIVKSSVLPELKLEISHIF